MRVGMFVCSAALTMGIGALAVACKSPLKNGAGGGGAAATTSVGGATSSASVGPGATTASTTTSMSATSSASSSTTSSGGPNSVTAWCAAHASTSTSTSSGGSVVFSIDVCKGPARQYQPPASPAPVSDYVYGINAVFMGASPPVSVVAKNTKWGLIRQGGDSDTDYNWTNDYSNSGADYCYFQGVQKNGNLAGIYTDASGDTIPAARAKGEAFLATIPILDFVSAAYGRNTGWDSAAMTAACPGTDPICSARSGSNRANIVDKFTSDPNYDSTLQFAYANDGSWSKTGSPAFIPNVMSKGSALCSCAPGTTSCTGCAVGTNPVAQDEFVNFLKVNYGNGGAPIFFDLDNEPNDWVSTHPENYPNNCSMGSVAWDQIATRDINAATAAKKAWPEAKIFGPVVTGDGTVYGGDYASPHFVAGSTEFSDWYLEQVASASVSAATPLIDVFDVHYYTVGSNPTDCMNAPRLFWDPNATDISAAATNNLDFQYGDHSYWDQYWYPRRTIPRLFEKIAAAYAGKSTTPPGLSFSEYNPGCEDTIAGGVAEADLLGIFGREGVFAATAWPLQGPSNNYLVGAFDLYRNYDGAGATVGDTAIRSTTSDTKSTSVYAFTHANDVTNIEIVAINKQSSAQMVSVQLASAPSLTTAAAYSLGANGQVAPSANPSVACAAGVCTLTMSLPATSATTIILH